jgi:AraC-like DNA-binding protein
MDNQFKEIYLTEYGREKCIATKDIITRPKGWHRLHYVLYGKGTFILNGKTYDLAKGDIFYIPVDAAPRYYPNRSDPWMYIWVGFNGDEVGSFLNACKINEQNPIFRDQGLHLKDLFNSFVDSCNRLGETSLNSLGIVLQIFGEMINMVNNKKEKPTPKEIYVKNAKMFMENNYQFQISVTSIANDLGLSPNYLANIFSEVLGMSTKQYLTRLRMEKACYLLINENLPIKEIAKMVGYTNQLHFSSEFRKVKKISPLLYRKNNVL